MTTIKDSIYLSVMKVLSENSIPYDKDVAVVVSEDLLKKVSDEVIANVLGKKVLHEIPEALVESSENLLVYVRATIGNWLRKDKRLNGGYAYHPVLGIEVTMRSLNPSSKEYGVLKSISGKVSRGEPLSWPEYTRLAKAAYDYGVTTMEDSED